MSLARTLTSRVNINGLFGLSGLRVTHHHLHNSKSAMAATATTTSFASPLLLLSRRHRHFAAVRLITNCTKRIATPAISSTNNNNRPSFASIKRFPMLSCYCTEPQLTNQATETIIEEKSKVSEDSKIKEAANTLDIRVGKILKVWRHEEADSLYVEEIDVGEPEPRTICSGLVKYIPLHLLQDRNVVVLANLKPRNMRGVKSNGMLMAASDASHENVELLVPPEGAVPGERVWFGSVDEKESLPDVATPNQVQKKKIWELIQPHLRTDESCAASLSTHPMRTSTGVVTSESLKNANIS